MDKKNRQMIERLKISMKNKGINARKLAKKANYGASFVYDLLSGKSTNPTYNRIKTIADILQVSPDFLIYGTEEYDDYTPLNIACLKVKKSNSSQIITLKKDNSIMLHKSLFKRRFKKSAEEIAVIKLDQKQDIENLKCNYILIDKQIKETKEGDVFLCYESESLIFKKLNYNNIKNLSQCDSKKPNERKHILGKVIFQISKAN